MISRALAAASVSLPRVAGLLAALLVAPACSHSIGPVARPQLDLGSGLKGHRVGLAPLDDRRPAGGSTIGRCPGAVSYRGDPARQVQIDLTALLKEAGAEVVPVGPRGPYEASGVEQVLSPTLNGFYVQCRGKTLGTLVDAGVLIEVLSRDAASGDELWRYTGRGEASGSHLLPGQILERILAEAYREALKDLGPGVAHLVAGGRPKLHLAEPALKVAEAAPKLTGGLRVSGGPVPAAAAIPAAQRETLVIMDLRPVKVDADTAFLLSEHLRSAVDALKRYRLVSREEMENIMRETTFQQSDLCDSTQCYAEIGGALGARWMLAGTVGRLGEAWSVTLKLIDIQEVRVERSLSRTFPGTPEEMPGHIAGLVGEVFR